MHWVVIAELEMFPVCDGQVVAPKSYPRMMKILCAKVWKGWK